MLTGIPSRTATRFRAFLCAVLALLSLNLQAVLDGQSSALQNDSARHTFAAPSQAPSVHANRPNQRVDNAKQRTNLDAADLAPSTARILTAWTRAPHPADVAIREFSAAALRRGRAPPVRIS